MARVLSAAQARIARVRSQRLAGPPGADAHDVVHGLLVVSAQDTRASRLAVRPRCRGTGIDAVAVVRACNQERSLVRTWLLRGTLHMAAAEDVRWLVALLGPVFAAGGGPRRLRLGLDEDTLARGLVALREILAAEGPLTRATLVEAIAIKGVVVAPRSQAPAHLVGYAAKRGLLCRGPDLEHDEPTYVLLDDWVDRPGRSAPELTLEREPEVALAELARRYLRAHAPAGDADFAAWSALPLHQAKRGFRHLAAACELDTVDAAGSPAAVLTRNSEPPPDPDEPTGASHLRLLGHFDPYLLGYRNRDLVLSPRFAKRIQAGGGIIHPAILLEGHVVGTWHQRRAPDLLTVVAEPFNREGLTSTILPALEAEAADVGRFLGTDATLTVTVNPGQVG